MADEKTDWSCSQCGFCKPLAAFSGQQRRKFSQARCHDCVKGSIRASQRPKEIPTDMGISPLVITDQDLEQALAAFENGSISRSVYLAAFSVREQQQYTDPDDAADRQSGLHAIDVGSTANARNAVAVRSLNWGYTRHLDRVFGLRCFSDMALKRLFLNAKDISESMSALLAVQRSKLATELRSGDDDDVWRWSSVACLAIGDGITPRTAGLASFVTKWDCTSVDPELYQEWVGCCPKDIGRLTGVRATFEDHFANRVTTSEAPAALIILCVHSHNRFQGAVTLERVRAAFGFPPTCLVAIPCCAEFNPTKDIGFPPDVRYDDWSIFSQCRTVLSWSWPAGSREDSPLELASVAA